jgi:hypothetical protein
VVGEPRALDGSGWVAPFALEQVVFGRKPEDGEIQLAWEELAAARDVRFQKGLRILVAVARVPSGSLWAGRFPVPEVRARTVIVAGRDQAFVRRPSLGALSLLKHYWALPGVARRGPDGLRHLAALAAGAERPLAFSAVRWLASIEDAAAATSPEVADLLVDALLQTEGDEPRRRVLLSWIGAARPPALGEALERRLTAHPRPPAVLYLALGHLEGSLGSERTRALLEAADPGLRAAGAAHAGDAELSTLGGLVASDPDADVRAVAAARAAGLAGSSGFEVALRAFEDETPAVRAAAAEAAARSPAFDAERLRQVIFDWPRPAPETAILTLRFAGSREARLALEEVARNHPDPGLQTLARIALGRKTGQH